MKYSVIDISSSSISLIVAESDGRKTEIVFKDRASISLLHYLDGKILTERGIEFIDSEFSTPLPDGVSIESLLRKRNHGNELSTLEKEYVLNFLRAIFLCNSVGITVWSDV